MFFYTMIIYSNSHDIRMLVEDTVDLKVKFIDNTFDVEDIKLYIFDTLFPCFFFPKYPPTAKYTFDELFRKKPDFAGIILEMMKVNEDVFLFSEEDVCYRVEYNSHRNMFTFIRRRECPPLNDAERVCFVSTKDLTSDMEEAIRDLLEPVRFCQNMSKRLLKRKQEAVDVKSSIKYQYETGNYKNLCSDLETKILNLMRQRDWWKDRFFFNALNHDYDQCTHFTHYLCSGCKEGMRHAFFFRGDEYEALRWRPGSKYNECYDKRCKMFGYYAFEDLEDIEEI